MEEFIINNINCFANFFDSMDSVVIYCHRFSENRREIYNHVFDLNRKKIGIITFDFPCHGKDTTNCQDINYDLCYQYIDNIVKYVKEKYPNTKIILMGVSFGGYMALNYINDSKMKFDKVCLLCPAINFYECMKRNLNIDDSYFNNHDYYELSSGYKIYKNFYFDCKKHDIMNNFNNHKNEIYIIQGSLDKTVLANDVIYFGKKNHLKTNIIIGADHDLDSNSFIVKEELLDYLSKI